MAFYVGLIDKLSEGAFGVWFPDLPGCTAMADSIDELFAAAVDVVRIWIEDAVADGEAVPASRDVAALLGDPDVQQAQRDDNASFIQIPLLLDQGRPARANISVDAGLLEAIDAAAKQRGLTRSAFLASAAREKIANGA